MHLAFAGRRFELKARDDRIPEVWQDAFAEYRHFPNAPVFPPDIRIDVLPRESWSNERSEYGVRIDESPCGTIRRVDVQIPDASGVFVETERGYSGPFELSADGIFGVSATLQIALALLVESAGGMLLHASGVLRDGVVWLFCGASGVGKTTIATELRDRGELFSADRVAIEFDRQCQLLASSTPFGDKPEERSEPMTAPVAGIAFISQAERTRVTAVSAFKATRRLFLESRWYSSDTIAAQRTLDNAARIVETGLCLNLEFTKNLNLWSQLDAWTAERTGSVAMVQR